MGVSVIRTPARAEARGSAHRNGKCSKVRGSRGEHRQVLTRLRIRKANLVCLCAGLSLLGACVAPGPSPLRYGAREIRGSEKSAVLDAGEAALTGLGYRIDRRDEAAGILITRPITGLAEGRLTARPARLTSRGDTRRVAEVRVEQTADAVSVYCRVLVQEQTTQAHRLFERDYRGYDTPTDTPIEREGATTVRQNTVWRTIRRDKHAEREILAGVTARTGASVPAEAGYDHP